MLLLNYFRELIAKHYGAIMYERRVDFYIDSIIFYTQFGIYALGYFYFTKLLKKQKEVNSSNQKLSLSEKVRLESENRVLKLDEEKIHLQTKLLLSEKEKLQSENEILRLREEKNTLQRKLLESEINYLRAKAKALDKAASDYQTMPSIFCGLSHVSIEYKYKYMYM